jgi:cell division inhibitor SulA
MQRGGDGIRTRVNGFAGRCLASRPHHRYGFHHIVSGWITGFTRADDEIRTRDPHLGKVMRYQLRHIRTARSERTS